MPSPGMLQVDVGLPVAILAQSRPGLVGGAPAGGRDRPPPFVGELGAAARVEGTTGIPLRVLPCPDRYRTLAPSRTGRARTLAFPLACRRDHGGSGPRPAAVAQVRVDVLRPAPVRRLCRLPASSVNLAPQAGRRASRSGVCSWATRRTRAWYSSCRALAVSRARAPGTSGRGWPFASRRGSRRVRPVPVRVSSGVVSRGGRGWRGGSRAGPAPGHWGRPVRRGR